MISLRVIGAAGTGKTTQAVDILCKAKDRPEVAGNPYALGLSSFTRAARTEAANRTAAAWGCSPDELLSRGWFRTAHSVAYKQLGIQRGMILSGGRDDDKWVSEALGSDVSYSIDGDEVGGVGVYTGDPVAAAALNYWSLARNLVLSLREVVEADQSPDAPSAEEVIKRVEQYEAAKRLDHRMDFTDMLERFVGVRNVPKDGPDFCAPEGRVPDEVVGWIFDEAQDASRLLDMACRRLTTGDSCRWAWLLGDPFQVLFSWAGASSKHFMSWDVKEQKVMPRSYRCAAPIFALGERCISGLPDYWDRGIAPADHPGEIVESDNFEDDLQDLSPAEETLVLARTNRSVGKIAAILDDIGTPYRRVKGKDGAHTRDVGMGGLWKLQSGQPISGEEWGYIIEMLPSKSLDGREWLVRGSKARWSKGLCDNFDRIYDEDLPRLGVTSDLRAAIGCGKWADLVDGGTKWMAAAKRHGVEAVSKPKIRIGTVHSAKGMEADQVVYLTSIGRRIRESEENDPAKWAEERRIEYVAVTRARRKLVVAHDPREKFRADLPL
jgi:DNA helicase-2/ATP-dependent DNA helicase PcrA